MSTTFLEHFACREKHTVDKRGNRKHPSNDRTCPGFARRQYEQHTPSRKDSRSEEVRKGLPRLDVTDEEGRNLVVEERAGNTAVAVRDVKTSRRVLHRALVEVTLEVRCAVLVSADLIPYRQSNLRA